MAVEELEVASCLQSFEVNCIHGNPLGGLRRSRRFLGEGAEAGGGAEVEEGETGGHRRAGPQRREGGVDQQEGAFFRDRRTGVEDTGRKGTVSLGAQRGRTCFLSKEEPSSPAEKRLGFRRPEKV